MPSLLGRALDGADRGVEAHSILTVGALSALCLFQGYASWHGQAFDAASFGQAVAMILFGGGTAAMGQGYLLGRTSYGMPRRPAIQPAPHDGANAKPDDPGA